MTFDSYRQRDYEMARDCSSCICVLPAYCGAITGSLLTLLVAESNPDAEVTCDVIRDRSETKTEEVREKHKELLEKHIIPLYREMYHEKQFL